MIIPGYAGILRSSRNPEATKLVLDVLLSSKGQDIISRLGDMHGVDPRLQGPRDVGTLAALLQRSQPWSEAFLERGLSDGTRIKTAFSEAFSR